MDFGIVWCLFLTPLRDVDFTYFGGFLDPLGLHFGGLGSSFRHLLFG